ncbi:GNAT family N-acetyltransferase [Pseudorhodobacter turbinis]|uniref:GNAT family N-acetyltransferase n=1 Tax=Pseudorhodobacter turbinis TaxID=2500533 RepID=A0A4P8EH04_9RHOB|nr:GNAT family N-acetyltransferase [Pseudorhodobacter turbinis]QCO56216.1 GNAT family N-acetyltransferase [Pseudorhodobacter turbinis]
MTKPIDIDAVTEATWPPASITQHGPWRVREGRSGGQRVSATTANGPVNASDIAQAEAAMAALGQTPLFMVRPSDAALDGLLDAQGYLRHDPVVIYAAPVTTLADPALSPMAAFTIWPPLGIATQLWAEAGIGAGRLAVMDRTQGPKTCLLGRVNDRAAGVAFIACHGKTAMLHALEISPSQRRNGAARNMMRAAAVWAADQGADTLCLAVTENNIAARALYANLGMDEVGAYHYRVKQG